MADDHLEDVGAGGKGSSSTKINDPLVDGTACARDIPYLVQLQTNTIRVYAIDPTKDHSACMTALQNAGIYVMADLSEPNNSINQNDPQWNTDLYARYTSVVDVLAPYNNVLGFFAGNEVSNAANNTDAMAFVKAAVRDMKTYISAKNYRTIGVGYAADDDQFVRAGVDNYLNCGPVSDAIDFFGYNIYSWCGDSSFQESGYADRTLEFSNYSVPAFFAEYGCNTGSSRMFTETLALYSSNMTNVWSGGIVYEYFQATNNFGKLVIAWYCNSLLIFLGLVSLDSTNQVHTLSDFSVLSSQIAQVTPTGVNINSYTVTNTVARDCPTEAPAIGAAATSAWEASPTLPPTPNEQLCGCMVNNLTCVAKPGLTSDVVTSLFGIVCTPVNGATVCGGIEANGTTGVYGAYSMCNSTDQLSWAFNAYYVQQVSSNSANTNPCDFAGNATTQTPTLPNVCATLVNQAGPAGTGKVTSAPSGTAAIGGGSGGGAASTTSGVAGMVTVPSFDFGLLKLGSYVTIAALAGAGIILF